MDNDAGNLKISENNYSVEEKMVFSAYKSMSDEDKNKCFEFAFGMSYGLEGKHRDSRSGGSEHRTLGQIFINTFQGKMAEYAVYRYLLSKFIELDEPDTTKSELGVWDSSDLIVQKFNISVKSTKFYGNLLLLEKKDWNEKGYYIPNIGKAMHKYDYIILVRFKPDGEKIMKDNKLLYLKEVSIPEGIKVILSEKVRDLNWEYDFPGFIYHSELVKMIKDERIIPKGAMLNGKISMDAENYYFQASNMHPMMELYTERIGLGDKRQRLIRKCPECGHDLVLKNGVFGYFWGCEGFEIKEINCKYTENLEKNT